MSHIILTDNRLTRVPNQVKLFERLYVVHLQNNSIETVQSGAFMSTRGGKDRLNVYLTDNQIRLIEPGAFQGLTTIACKIHKYLNVILILKEEIITSI